MGLSANEEPWPGGPGGRAYLCDLNLLPMSAPLSCGHGGVRGHSSMPPHSTHSTLLAQPSSRLCYHIEQKGAGGEEEITPLQSFPAAVTAQNKLVWIYLRRSGQEALEVFPFPLHALCSEKLRCNVAALCSVAGIWCLLAILIVISSTLN